MTVKDLMIGSIALWMIISSIVEIRKTKMDLETYSTGRGLPLLGWFCLKVIFLTCAGIYFCGRVPSNFWNYELL